MICLFVEITLAQLMPPSSGAEKINFQCKAVFLKPTQMARSIFGWVDFQVATFA